MLLLVEDASSGILLIDELKTTNDPLLPIMPVALPPGMLTNSPELTL